MHKNKTIVIKVGTKVITAMDRALDRDRVKDLVRQIADIQDTGARVILVTSGAIGAGMWLLNLKKRPAKLPELQAAASIGQGYLVHIYSEYFKERGYLVGQVLLTQEDFNGRKRYLNIKHTLETLIGHNAIPVINENDTVATEEIACGDNDRLSSLVADMCRAGKLIILTDVDGLLDEEGRVIGFVGEVDSRISKLAGKSSCDLGTGGMASKIECARNVAASGIECVIANGRSKDILLKIMEGKHAGTVFGSQRARFIAKKRWIAFSSMPKGRISVDDGASEALVKRNKSLLASGILRVEGSFSAGDVVSILDKNGCEIARGISNYTSEDASKIKGLNTSKFESVLGRTAARDEVIHKDNLVIL